MTEVGQVKRPISDRTSFVVPFEAVYERLRSNSGIFLNFQGCSESRTG